MSYMTGTNIFAPEVLGANLSYFYMGQSAFYNSGIANVVEGTFANGGNTVTVAGFNGFGNASWTELVQDASTNVCNTAYVPSWKTETYTLKTFNLPIRGQRNLLQQNVGGYDKSVQDLIKGIFTLAVDKIDSDILTVLTNASYSYAHDVSAATDKTVSAPNVYGARMKYPDAADSTNAILVTSATGMQQLVSSFNYNQVGDQHSYVSGQLTTVAGASVLRSDKIVVDSTKYTNILALRGSVDVIFGEQLHIDEIKECGGVVTYDASISYVIVPRLNNSIKPAVRLITV